MKNNIIKRIEEKQINKKLLIFRSGDSVSVKTWVFEGNKKRLQVFEGIVISIRKRGLNTTFTVRKNSHGEGVERLFYVYSPIIESIVIKRYGKVRKAKLYYLRNFVGKSSKIKERLT